MPPYKFLNYFSVLVSKGPSIFMGLESVIAFGRMDIFMTSVLLIHEHGRSVLHSFLETWHLMKFSVFLYFLTHVFSELSAYQLVFSFKKLTQG